MTKKIKYLIIYMMFSIFNSVVSFSAVPANTNIGIQATISYKKITGDKVFSFSNIVILKVNEVVSYELQGLINDITVYENGEFIIPYSISNSGNITDSYLIYLESLEYIDVNNYFIDSNNNGILEADETTELKKIDDIYSETPKIEANQIFHFFLVGKLKPNIVDNIKINIKLNTKSNLDKSLIQHVETQLTTNLANKITIKKYIAEVPNTQIKLFVFKFINIYSNPTSNIVLDDNIDSRFILAGDKGYWLPFGKDKEVVLTFQDDGKELNAKDLALKIANNVMTLTMDSIPGNALESNSGGYLYIPVIVNPGVSENTVLKNKATYNYFDGKNQTSNYTTPEATYIVPYISVIDLQGDSVNGVTTLTFKFENYLTNLGNSSDIFSLSLVNNSFPNGTLFNIELERGNGEIENKGDILVGNFISLGEVKQGEKIKIKVNVTIQDPENLYNNYAINKLILSKKNPTAITSVTDSFIGYKIDDNFTFEKFQGLDINNDGILDIDYTKNDLEVKTNYVIYYKLVFTNKDKITIENIILSDKVPDNTTINNGDGSLSPRGVPCYAVISNTGINNGYNRAENLGDDTIGSLKLDLKEGEKIELYFSVNIDE